MRPDNTTFLGLLLLAFAMVGCTPLNQEPTVTPIKQIQWTTQIVQDAVHNRTTPFATDQLVIMAGEPDAKMPVSSLAETLVKSSKCTPHVVDDIIRQIFQGYLKSTSPRSESDDWKMSQGFLHCEVWLYNWNRPSRLYIGGVIPRKTTTVRSDYFLIKDGKVIDTGGMIRPAEE